MKNRVIISLIFLFTITSTALAQKMTVKDSDTNVLMEVNDEGVVGSITLPSGAAPSTTTYKLYNMSGTLYWNGSQLGTAGSAGGWTDDGTVVRLSTGTDKVGIGVTTPTYPLDVDSTIGMNNTQVLYLPNQTKFQGTLIVGTGGGSLSHSSGSEGQRNTAVGIGALNANEEGYRNTASGSGALFSNTTGYYNTGIGYYANAYNQTGSKNTIIGYEAGYSTPFHDKTGNVFIGYQAGYNENGDNKLYIENSNSSSPLIGGDFSTDRVGINTNSPSVTLEVSGTDAIMVPVGTTAERPSSAAAGMIRFNSETSKFEGYDGTDWVNLN